MADPRTTAARLASQLRKTFGQGLQSVVLFGSVPRGEAIPGVSDLNVLVLLDSLAPAELARAAPVLQDWIRHGNTPPHLYAADEWAGMADTFAIEMADMQDAREVLSGIDPISAGSVTNADLRLHTEQEIRETMLHLRLRLLLGANSPDEVGNLLLSGLPSFTAYMRASLRLSGVAAPPDSRSVIELASRVIDADAKPMLTCWQTRRTMRRLAVPITDPLVEEYTAFTRRLITYLDQAHSADPPLRVEGTAEHAVPAHH